MAIEYLLVTYPEQRAVLADGNGVGSTNHTFMLPTDEYLIIHQHPCFQRLLMDMDIKAEFVDPVFAKTGCRQAAD